MRIHHQDIANDESYSQRKIRYRAMHGDEHIENEQYAQRKNE